MDYNILGVNLSHNSSIALVSDGRLVFYLEEERLSRKKKDEEPYFLLKKYLKKFSIDEIIFSGISFYHSDTINLLKKSIPFNIKWSELFENHHLTHAYYAFVNSGFKEANNIVIDFGGSIKGILQESESIFYFSLNSLNEEKIYKSYNNIATKSAGITKTYSGACIPFGINLLDGGKLMGLSSYGQFSNFPHNFFKDGKSNPKLFHTNSHEEIFMFFNDLYHPKTHYIETLKNNNLSQIGKNLAYKIQQEAQEEVAKLVEKSLQINNCNNITISGGFGLNCVNNYFLKKNFPNVNFYFEPLSHDGGTAIGAAYIRWKKLNPNFIFTPQKFLYLGPQYSKNQLLKGIKKYVSN